MNSVTFEIRVFKYINMIFPGFYCNMISMASSLKKDESKLDLLTDIDMLLIIQKGTIAGICHTI